MAWRNVRKLSREIVDMYWRILRGLWRFTPAPPPTRDATRKWLPGGLVVRRAEEVAAAYTVWGDVLVGGRVAGDVRVISGLVEVQGVVSGDVRVLFGDVRVGGAVGGSVEVGFGDVVLTEGPSVGGSVTVGVGSVNGEHFGPRSEYHPRLPAGVRVGGLVRTEAITNRLALEEAMVLAAVVALLTSLGALALYVKSVRR